ncbi:MAG: hypothetical protein HQM16_19015, partial [Deltaproteobacteria bacterium]|nr:hypothetical protein [Deltaproteobacteria bacterium]
WGWSTISGPAFHEYVQRQCVSYDATSGMYITDETLGSLAIHYAPTPTCSTEAGNDFIYNAVDSTVSSPYTNDRYDDSTAVTHDLLDISEMVFTLPTVPTDVY